MPSTSDAARTGSAAFRAAAKVWAYAAATASLALRRPGCLRARGLVRHFPAWWSSLDGPAATDVPWLCFEAIDLLDAYLEPEMSVFEYGAGGSTLFFSRRVSRVWSVEHDRAWHAEVSSRLERVGATNCELLLIEPEPRADGGESDPADPLAHGSGDVRFRQCSFERYVNGISRVPDASLDLVLVDGRARPACCRKGMAKVKPGGLLVLDNAEVPYYVRARQLLAPPEWTLRDVFGPVPGVRHFSETCIWRRTVGR